MKKAMLIGAALATLCVSSSANAIVSFSPRTLFIDGTAVTLGSLVLMPLGATGAFPAPCLYQAAWLNAQNNGQGAQCQVLETRTVFSPDCATNGMQFVQGALLQQANQAACSGFDATGALRNNVQILLGEGNGSAVGLIVEPVGAATAFYPIHTP